MHKNKKVRVLSDEEISEIKTGTRCSDACFCIISENGELKYFDDLRTITDCERLIYGDIWEYYETSIESDYTDFKICTPVAYSI